MKITAVTRLKWGALYEALSKAGWTAAELARRVGYGPSQIGVYLNLQKRPSLETIRKIEEVFIAAGVNVDLLESWPEEFKGFKNRKGSFTQTKEIPMDFLQLYEAQPTPLQICEESEMGGILDVVINTLPPRLQKVLDLRFGLNGEEEHSLREVGEMLGGYTGERVRQMEARALRMLRHPSRARHLQGKDYKGYEGQREREDRLEKLK